METAAGLRRPAKVSRRRPDHLSRAPPTPPHRVRAAVRRRLAAAPCPTGKAPGERRHGGVAADPGPPKRTRVCAPDLRRSRVMAVEYAQSSTADPGCRPA